MFLLQVTDEVEALEREVELACEKISKTTADLNALEQTLTSIGSGNFARHI